MKEKRSYGFDRRSDSDRRTAYSMDYFSKGGVERRRGVERRAKVDRRDGWVRVSEWCSMYLGSKRTQKRRKP